MDAKPQRLARSRTVRDENQAPLAMPTKTLHHRNKSSPALSSLAQGMPGKNAQKRTAFADVTNASRGLNLVVDDAMISQKGALEALKEKITDQSKPGAPLQKPAQRPISVSSIKGFFNNLGTSTQQNAVPKKQPEQVENRPSKALSRKNTKVFREPDVVGLGASSVPVISNDVLDPTLVDHQQKPSHLTVVEPQHVDIRSDGVPIQEPAYIPTDVQVEPISASNVTTTQQSSTIAHPQPVRPTESLHQPKKVDRRSGSSGLTSYATVPEQWEAEHYVESEGDYTTARSLKSRGECTTNQTTVVLAPKGSATAEREIAEANIFVQTSQEALELEEDESWDTSMVAEYSDEIFSYMRSMEEQMRPNPHYMDNQTEVQWSMRSVLMDWLVQVHLRFSLLPETLFLCVNYIDRFLSCKVVSLGKLQLVGATAIFVAAKYEEINCPSVQEIVYMVDGGYSIDEILKAERFMLSMLQFELGFPGPMSFLRRISKADDYDLETRTLAKYFMEFTIMDERFVGCIPSYTAAGAHCLARLMLDKGEWSQKHVHYSGYTYSQLRPLLLTMMSCCDDPQRHHAAIFDKYADKRFKRASTFVQAELNKGFILPAVAVRNSIGYEDGNDRCQPYLYQ